jgi:hypothetical protein
MFRRLSLLSIMIAVIFLLTTAFGSSLAIAADDDDDEPSRSASWHETSYQTDAWGRTWTIGQFGPDLGYGEQGSIYEHRDPTTGAYISYSSTSMGMGAGGPMMGYGGMFSPLAEVSYGPYAGGGRPNVGSTPGYDTQGYLSGSLWGNNTSYYEARPNPMAQMMFGLMGGGFGGFGGYGGGYGGFGGSYGAPSYSGYGAQSYGGFGGFSPFGSFGGSSIFGGYGGYGGYGVGGYPTRIY